jgi:8-oxo-dGTP pyrophosphatase MutT (NUDIX family)
VKQGLSPEARRAWISERLDPLEAGHASRHGPRSDFDLDLDHGLASHDPGTLKPAAVLIGLVDRPGGFTMILTRRSDTLRNHTGQVALPGGRRDPGETAWAAALREAEEEIGLDPARVELVGLSTAYRTGTGYHVTPVVGFVTPPIELMANPAEVAEIFEPPFDFLMDPANHERRQGRTPAGDARRFYAITWGRHLIWGATAGMLRALHDRLYGAALD